MLNRFKTIGGWQAGEVAFLYALLILSHGIVSSFFSGMTEFSQLIREGTFDRVLLRPLSTLGQILSMKFEPGGLAHLILGIAALVVADRMAGIEWDIITVIFFALAVAGGALILASVRVAVAAVAFFTVSNQGLQHLVVFSAREFLMYPLNIYNSPVRWFLTFLFPLAFVNFYPAHLFLDKEGSILFHPYFAYATLPVGLLWMYMALMLWRAGVRHYGSTGS